MSYYKKPSKTFEKGILDVIAALIASHPDVNSANVTMYEEGPFLYISTSEGMLLLTSTRTKLRQG